jgi:4'-phosphopantetheinyl transferase EntD
MAGILPAGVAVAEWTGAGEPPPLLPAETELVAGAAPGRRHDLAVSRACARGALARLGHQPVPVLMGPDREPVWPGGVVGSLTHCAGYGAAAVAAAARFAAIGIDAEVRRPLPGGVLGKVALPPERAWLEARPAGGCWDRLLFGAKESVFKAWFPLTGAWLEFRDALVTFEPATGAFSARLLVPGPAVDGRRVEALAGRYVVTDGLVLTAIAVERASGAGDVRNCEHCGPGVTSIPRCDGQSRTRPRAERPSPGAPSRLAATEGWRLPRACAT